MCVLGEYSNAWNSVKTFACVSEILRRNYYTFMMFIYIFMCVYAQI